MSVGTTEFNKKIINFIIIIIYILIFPYFINLKNLQLYYYITYTIAFLFIFLKYNFFYLILFFLFNIFLFLKMLSANNSFETIFYFFIKFFILFLFIILSYKLKKKFSSKIFSLMKKQNNYITKKNILKKNNLNLQNKINSHQFKFNLYKKINLLGNKITEETDKKKIIDILLSDLKENYSADFVSLYFFPKKINNDKYEFYYKNDFNREEIPSVLDTYMENMNRNLLIKNFSMDYRFSDIVNDSNDEYQSIIAVIVYDNKNKKIAVLKVCSEKIDYFGYNDLRLLVYISGYVSLSLINSYFIDKTKQLARHDGLTKIYKRWFFTELVENKIKLCKRENKKIAILIFDIDNFKNFNDTYGHLVGDSILSLVGKILKKSIRENDIAARYGGEEFIVSFDYNNKEEVIELSETIRKNIEIQVKKNMDVDINTNVTVSGGISFLLSEEYNLDVLIKNADILLYKAKAEGKNKICYD